MENLKHTETWNVINYIKGREDEVTVSEILENADVDKLRIYGIITELLQIGFIEVTKRSEWGAPRAIRCITIQLPYTEFY